MGFDDNQGLEPDFTVSGYPASTYKETDRNQIIRLPDVKYSSVMKKPGFLTWG